MSVVSQQRVTYDDGVLDEIVADGVDVHLEAMADGVYWLGLSRGDQRLTCWIQGDVGGVEDERMGIPVEDREPLLPGHDELDAIEWQPGAHVRLSIEAEVTKVTRKRADLRLANGQQVTIRVGDKARLYGVGA